MKKAEFFFWEKRNYKTISIIILSIFKLFQKINFSGINNRLTSK